MELIVEFEFISGDQENIDFVWEDEQNLAKLLTDSDWFNFDGRHINMRNVKAFRVISREQKELEDTENSERHNQDVQEFFNIWNS